ncbi:MAG: hypothetical protein A3A96_03085 [Candidatus Zambryskibacteria bacterium RIFCSPLOWO2_01_FULL_39_39]|uniref:Uncharacterized protein n=1 Tax=Candidatus Zambryskibacteria bacterium RIFCSPLOWO2_01_FULL_39_39 TaxID=1802758 RepID=A0A1G2TWD6_9BACT|nr:MAG: hypothetical protein UT00_C0002G0007 [Parcubacteria group bacterium GW2011_GWA1_38_7]OHA87643.1 MAG: hypothetical protein A2644_02475 [Candidatus Zambryskibacteria bacterium RIFCSPHIGHO2_01_FULL_39_63]OHA94421.1 MAG: hypothetical protein A3B88_01840 [Candidatus Zambryskibacteria bacterium RIFCSPHIGHO2_02_FULL_39_19]OHA98767.1 MAG: hypothetical protein A3F20_00770 [Candidatus Zambryskibacteria bacterium RIFCSPHIGHO2_12_FULL_39_21]OHB01625.1 MAG: hypothetical protein A3A96_03085 [Candidat
MYNISGFLHKFLNLERDNNTKLSVILETIKKETDIELSKEMLEIKGDNLKINCNPVFRNEIFMHQSQIENSLKSSKIFLKII